MLAVALLGAIAVGQFRSSLDERLQQARVSTEVRQTLRTEAEKLAEARIPAEIRARSASGWNGRSMTPSLKASAS